MYRSAYPEAPHHHARHALSAPQRRSAAYEPAGEALPLDQLLLGDCVEILRTLPAESVDMIQTDPPYGVNYAGKDGRSIQGDRPEDMPMIREAFIEAYRVLRPNSLSVSFYGWTKADVFWQAWKAAGFRVVGHLVFCKRYSSSARFLKYHHESAVLLAKGQPTLPEHPIGDVLEWTYSRNLHHPTEKSPATLAQLIESFCPPGGTVLDMFAGSASACVAAQSVGRHFVGIEIDPKYHAIASKRLASYKRRMADALGLVVPSGHHAQYDGLAH